MKPKFRSQRSRCDVVRAAERGEEVVERVIVRQVDDGKLRTPFVLVAVEQVVMADGKIEEIPGCDARRIVIVILGVWRRHLDKLEPNCDARHAEGSGVVGVARTPLQVNPASNS